ncbi:DNA-binding protein [Burkholderia sp. WAC0059]|uniref:helix-turn-helix transcriptional regulator n=1 Tax=Burkholderia sp. WAC0059 TaxID=2066022 RepID=UPI000C7F08DD|nr:helix-turn-helix domain-containing protein [Burkholderia sp. WAC0059]PLZ02395.1 DNA-binding protein [Burkholderia sp. WAC0059]
MAQQPTPRLATDATVIRQINKQTLCERLSISERTLENMVREGSFPPPVRIGKHVYWTEVAVRRWQEQVFSAQENWSGHQ